MKVTLYIDGEHNTVEVKDKIKSVLPDANYMIFHPADNVSKVTEFDRIKNMSVQEMAEIKRLKAEDEKYPFKCVMPFNSMVYSKSIEDYDRLIGDIGSDAIKEFAERLKDDMVPNIDDSYIESFVEEYIDNLVKEMVGEE